MNISICEPHLSGREEEYVLEALRSGWISSQGTYVSRFEESFSRFCRAKHAITTTSGTTALHLALAALDVGPGAEVLLPTFTMVASLFSILYTGATPVFVDALQKTWCLNPEEVTAKMTPKTKVILPVHIYGHPCDMEAIMSIAERQQVSVVEDAAEAHGAMQGVRRVGSFGDLGCFSFYANKIVTTGEGGMVVTSDHRLAERCRCLKNLAFLPDPSRRFEHHEVGFNYRMTNLQAAIGMAQMERVDELIERRRKNAVLYLEHLRAIPDITLPVEQKGYQNVYWMYGVLIGDSHKTDIPSLREKMQRRGIDTRRFFLPLHRQPVVENLGFVPRDSFPVADNLYERGIILPSGSGLNEKQIASVVQALRESLGVE